MLCKERVGSCIQCSVKTCKTAYHVTCAFKKGLEMKAIVADDHAEDGVKLRVRLNPLQNSMVSAFGGRKVYMKFYCLIFIVLITANII